MTAIKETMNKKLEYWKKKLIDLSKRNNLVSYRFTKSKSLKIIQPPIQKVIENLNDDANIEFLIEEDKSTPSKEWLCSEDKETVAKKLYKLYLTTKGNFQELGVNTCFVGVYMFHYQDSKDSTQNRMAPIFLYQVDNYQCHYHIQQLQYLPEKVMHKVFQRRIQL